MTVSKAFLIASALVFILAAFGVNFCVMWALGVGLYVASKVG